MICYQSIYILLTHLNNGVNVNIHQCSCSLMDRTGGFYPPDGGSTPPESIKFQHQSESFGVV